MAKKTKNPTEVGVTQSDIDQVYDTIYKQNRATNNRISPDWRPTVVPLGGTQTPVTQGQVTGALSWDNTPMNWVAPGYGELKDISILKDTEAKFQKTAWEKAKESLFNLGSDSTDPSFIQAKMKMNEAIDNYDKQLKGQLWSDNENRIDEFTSELLNKKGGRQFLAMKQADAANRERVGEAIDEYDPVTSTGGIQGFKKSYYLTPQYKAFEFDSNGNVIGGGQVTYPEIYKERNLFSELDKATKDTKAFQDIGQVDENGNRLYLVDTGMFGKYMNVNEKYVTEDRIREIAKAHLLATGGYEYIQNEAKIKEFNQPLTTDEARIRLSELASIKGGKDNHYTVLNNLSDKQLQESLKSGLGVALQAVDLNNSLLSGAISKSAYSEKTLEFVDDTVAQFAQNEYTKSLYDKASKSGAGNGDEEGRGLVPYSFMNNTISTYETFDPSSAVSLQNQRIKLADEQVNLTAQLTEMIKNPGYQNDANYQQAIQRKADIDAQLVDMQEDMKKSTKVIGNIIKKDTQVGLYSLYSDFAGQAKFEGKGAPDRDTFNNAISAAILAEADEDPRTTAEDILNKNGIGTNIDYDNNKFINSVDKGNMKGWSVITGSKFTSKNEGATPIIEKANKGDLLSIVRRGGAALKKESKERNHINNSETIKRDTSIFTIEGDTEKFVEAKRFANAEKNLTDFVQNNLETLRIFNPSGNPNEEGTLASFISNKTGLEIKDINKAMVLSKASLSTTQSFGKDKGSVYVAQFKLKNITQKDDPDIYDIQEKIREKLAGNTTLNYRFTLDKNQKAVGEEMQIALKELILANKGNISGLTATARNRAALALGNMDGTNNAIDMLNIYNLDGSGRNPNKASKNVKYSGYDLRITARDLPFAKKAVDKDFTIQVKDEGVYKTVGFLNGQAGLYTDEELKANPQITRQNFDTDLDIKAYLNLLRLDSESSFNKGSGDSSVNFTGNRDIRADKSKQYSTTLIRNGRPFETNTYVNPNELINITGKVKLANNAGIPYLHKDIAQNATTVLNSYGLTVTGGLRTKEHFPSNSAPNSSHFNGYAVDVKDDINSNRFFKEINKNPKLKERLGITFTHDGDHVHITFLPKKSNIINNTNFRSNRIMDAIAEGESGNRDLGYHDTSKSSAHGKYGFTNMWYDKMAKYFGKSIEDIRNNPTLVKQYANTEYLKIATDEMSPYLPKLTEKLSRNIPSFSKEDAIFIYHYAGLEFLKELANGTKSVNDIPRADVGNRETIKSYVMKKRKYL